MEKMKKYSGLFIISPEKEEVLDEVTGKITSVVEENSGKIIGNSLTGMKDLAYPIKKHERAIYFELDFEMEPSKIGVISRQYRIDDSILRSIIERS